MKYFVLLLSDGRSSTYHSVYMFPPPLRLCDTTHEHYVWFLLALQFFSLRLLKRLLAACSHLSPCPSSGVSGGKTPPADSRGRCHGEIVCFFV